MKTKMTMNLPQELLEQALEASGATNKTMAVVWGLEELIRKKHLNDLLKLKGSGAIALSKKTLLRWRKR